MRPYGKRHGNRRVASNYQRGPEGVVAVRGKSYEPEHESSDRPWAHGCTPLQETTRQPTGCQHPPKGPGRARGGAASLMGQNMNPATGRGHTAVGPYGKRHGNRRVASNHQRVPEGARSGAAGLMGQNMNPATGGGRTAVRPYQETTRQPTGCQQSPRVPEGRAAVRQVLWART